VREVQDLSFLDTINDIEDDGQNRAGVHNMIHKQHTRVHLRLHGFDMELLGLLLNSVPMYDSKKTRGAYSDILRESIFERDNFECRLCHSNNNIVCHHIVPNGPGNDKNLITLCTSCHTCIHLLLNNKGYVYTNSIYW